MGRGPLRVPVPVLLLGCLPVLAAAAGLALYLTGPDRPSGPHARATARPESRWSAPRPDIVPRSSWLGDAARRQPPPRYDDEVVAVFVHHTDTP
ncbi:N-acetylmuramoyl-L-alanine amidase, partial [Streptomyces sp. TRM76130]|nr:N-acetylmuramoyl-L-alanine amidase [Streptomyces sp. TRM76130]